MRGVTNNMEVRIANRNRVFQYVNQRERISKQEIANALGMSAPTVQQMVRELEELGLVIEMGEFQSTGGRKAKAIGPNWGAVYALGLDITKNHISMVLTNLSEHILDHVRIYKPFEATDKYYEEIAAELKTFVANNKVAEEKVLGVGISVPGIVDGEKNEISYSHVLKVSHIPCEEIGKYMEYTCVLLNDANAAAITELYSNRSKNLVYISLSNSVGGAVYHDGLYVGDNWRSGEFGHIVLNEKGPVCYCGKRGCLDVYCSALRLAEEADGKLEKFFEGVKRGELKCREALHRYLAYLACAVENLHMVFDCDIVLGGYVGAFLDEYIEEFRDMIKEKNIFEENGSYVKACRYKVGSSALGAAQFYIKEHIKNI